MNIDDEYMCVSAQECTWIFTDDPYTDECTPPTKEPTPLPTPLPTPDDEGCCSGTDYDIHSYTYCAKFDNGVDCAASPVCDWIGGEYAECEPPTEPPSETEPPAPTPSPTPGCCYSDGKYAAFCFSLEDSRSCTAAPNCDWEETDDYTVCEPPTPTPTTPAPVYEEGCCTGYSPKTYAFCSDLETGEECERGGVCSWIPTDDPDDCILTEPPSATMPPAPTKGPGCCTGNSPRTWSYCLGITMPYQCQTAEECTWYEGDPYDPECTPPTPEPTPSTTPGEPTQPPTEEKGCCYGSTASSNTYCAAMGDNSKQCDAAPNCEWIVTDDPYDCVLTQPPNTVPTKQPTTPWPTYTEYGCCTGYSPRTYSFCEKYETGAECEGAGVCSWISTYDESDCEPPTEPPSYTLPPAPTPGPVPGCCAGNSPRTWSFCVTVDDEYSCIAADECTWIPTDDPYVDECTPPTKDPTPDPTPSPTHDDKGCCSGTDYDIHSYTFCAKFSNGEDCEAAPVCDWIAGEYAECEPPTEPPSETEPPAPTPGPIGGCCYGDDPYAAFCFSLEDERSCSGAPNCDWEETDDYSVCEPPTPPPTTSTTTTPAPVYEEGCCTGYSPKTYTFCMKYDTGAECENAGVCSWIATDDPEDCILTEPPVETMPPAPTFGPGCCTGNSPRTWAFCSTIDEVRNCMEADE